MDVRRVPSRQVGVEVAQGSLDFGVVTFQPAERGLLTLNLGPDDLVMLVHPQHPLAGRKEVSMAEFGRETVIAHNDPSPARERVLRTFELKHAPINIQVALPSLEAIKRAVEMKMGVALLPRRCALSELSRGQLAAVKIPQVRLARQLRLVYRRAGELSHAAQAFLAIAKHQHPGELSRRAPATPPGSVISGDRTRSLVVRSLKSESEDPWTSSAKTCDSRCACCSRTRRSPSRRS